MEFVQLRCTLNFYTVGHEKGRCQSYSGENPHGISLSVVKMGTT